jgi:hypothetical protein
MQLLRVVLHKILGFNCALPHNVNQGEFVSIKIDSTIRVYEIFSFGDGTFGLRKFCIKYVG